MTLIKKTITATDHNHEEDVVAETDYIPVQVNTNPGKTVRYDLYVKDTTVNFTGKNKRAIAINGMIPAPALVFNEGDSAEIYLHNLLKEETSLHWHGVILPNQADGVPFLTTAPVHPGETHVYKFKVVQNGTYWYHSHNALQEQIGMHGALIFKKSTTDTDTTGELKPDPGSDITHLNVVLSEWPDDNPMQIQRRLRTGNDWMAIKKGSTQSYAEAISEGYFKTKLLNEWKRMKAMDVSDVFYDRFLTNGKTETAEPHFKAGDKIRLHVVNAGASSYFWLGFGGGKITVVGNDGNEMQPVKVDRLLIAPAETFDLEVTIPADMSYEFRATAEDRTGYSSLWLGNGMKMPAPTLPRLKYFEGMKMMNDMMKTNGEMKDMGMKMSLQQMDMNMVMYPEITGGEGDDNGSKRTWNPDTGHDMDHSAHTNMNATGEIVTLNYNMLRSPVKTSLPEGPKKQLHFELTGNMNRYVWTLNNKTVTETDRILINKGESVQMILTNNSMMRHPMHLHGHDFRVLNSSGEYSPLKNVIDIMPMETDTIEFAANQNGNWFFHCHILYHMMAGMGRVFTYTNSTPNPELPDAEEAWRKFRRHKDQTMKHLMARIGIESNGSDGEAMLSNNRYALKEMWHIGFMPEHGYESETIFGRYFGVNQWLFPYLGFDYHRQKTSSGHSASTNDKNMFGQISNKSDRKTYVIGIEYTLPWLVLGDARVDGDGKFRLQLSREDIPVTPRLRMHFMGNTDKEYAAGLRYIISKWFAASTHYDSDMGLGAGITITY
jgi:CopA family copper-resistance protein